MKSFKQFNQSISESASRSISRLRHHIEGGKTIGIVSASRGNLSAQENNERTRDLHTRLKADGYQPIRVRGDYIEDHNGKPKRVQERSFVIHHDDAKKVRSDIQRHGKAFGQDSVISVSKKTGTTSHVTNSGSDRPLGSTDSLGGAGILTGPDRETNPFKSRLKRRPFVLGGDTPFGGKLGDKNYFGGIKP